MRFRLCSLRVYCSIVIGWIGLAPPGFAFAQTPRDPSSPMAALVRLDERFQPREALVPLADHRATLAPDLDRAWNDFQLDHGDWQAYLDARNGFVESAEGAGIPWVSRAGPTDLPTLERLARRFIAVHAGLFGTDGKDLRLAPGRSGPASDALWLVDFDLARGDLAIEGARIVFRIGHGNLIQIGSERLPSAKAAAPPVRVTSQTASATLSRYVGGFDPQADTWVDRGSLHLLPVAVRDDRFAEGFEFGQGYGLLAVWQFSLRREGLLGTWRGRVDATTGEIVEFVNTDLDAHATGGVAADTITGTETNRPMPFADLGNGLFTNSAGAYKFNGTPLLSTLSGQLVGIVEACGGISLTTNASGDLPFGSASGNNCITPGVGGEGNTRAARTSFYHVNRSKEIARGWLPDNAWLAAQVTVSVNNNGACNGFWNGSQLLLYSAIGGACGASGEEPGFILHEFGHGIDQNDGSGLESTTTEAYADVTAALTLHNSCVGPGFRLANCDAYGDPCTACTGLRDIDWAKHASAAPHTVGNFTQPFCLSGGGGPCGGEPHCEAHVPAEAIWDFANRDLPAPAGAAAWNVLERLWYLSRPTATEAFTCNPGPTLTSNGCNVGSWWKTMRALDDDDGDLANGTPHSCNLYAAFNRHGIACTTDPGADTCFRACTESAVPTVTLTTGTNATALSWSNSGVGAVYDVYRNEIGCNSGFAKIADDVAGASFADDAVANGSTYYYQVVAHPSGNEACHSAPSACLPTTKNAQVLSLSVPPTKVGGQQVTVSLTVRNTGGLTWNPIGPQCNAYRLAQVGNAAWSPTRAEFSAPVLSGEEATLSFAVLAPPTAGTYNFQMQMVHECVEFFGASSANVAVTVEAAAKHAQIVAQSVPSNLAAGQPFSGSVTVRNAGTLTWSPVGPQCNAYRLAQIGNPAWAPIRVEFPSALAPGQQVVLPFNGTAPSTPGIYDFQVRMVHECVEFFGDAGPVVAVTVGAGPKHAQIVAQSVPSNLTAGQPYSGSVTVQNVGTLNWSPVGPQCNAYRLAQIGNPAWTPIRVELPSALAPGQQVVLPFNGTAPSTPGTYNFQVKMVHECVEFFDDSGPVVAVNVAP